MPEGETPDVTSLRLESTEIISNEHGMYVKMKFTDGGGTIVITPEIPYPDNFDPMLIQNAQLHGHEVRILDPTNGTIVYTVDAEEMKYENPIDIIASTNREMALGAINEEQAELITRTHAMFSAIGRDNERQQQIENRLQDQINRASDPYGRGNCPDGFTWNIELERCESRPGDDVTGPQAWFRTITERNNMTIDTGGAFDLTGEAFGDLVSPDETRAQFRQAGFPFTTDRLLGQEEELTEESCQTPKMQFKHDMKCVCCEDKIHYPEKIIKLLGEEGTKTYLNFCEKTGNEPEIFCCACYSIMSNNPNIITMVNKMYAKIKTTIELDERDIALRKREEELDKQLYSLKNKQNNNGSVESIH